MFHTEHSFHYLYAFYQTGTVFVILYDNWLETLIILLFPAPIPCIPELSTHSNCSSPLFLFQVHVCLLLHSICCLEQQLLISIHWSNTLLSVKPGLIPLSDSLVFDQPTKIAEIGALLPQYHVTTMVLTVFLVQLLLQFFACFYFLQQFLFITIFLVYAHIRPHFIHCHIIFPLFHLFKLIFVSGFELL